MSDWEKWQAAGAPYPVALVALCMHVSNLFSGYGLFDQRLNHSHLEIVEHGVAKHHILPFNACEYNYNYHVLIPAAPYSLSSPLCIPFYLLFHTPGPRSWTLPSG